MVDNRGVGQRELDGDARRYHFKGGDVAVSSRFHATIRPCFKPCCVVNMPCEAFATVRWPNGCKVRDRKIPRSAQASGRVSRRISLLRLTVWWRSIRVSRRYRVTHAGQRFMSTAIDIRYKCLHGNLVEWSSAFRRLCAKPFCALTVAAALRVRAEIILREVII